jgi:hypothetical protein
LLSSRPDLIRAFFRPSREQPDLRPSTALL